MPDAELTTVEGREFGEEVVPADGIEFVRCRFDGTVLVFRGENNFMLRACSGQFHLTPEGAALTVLNQLAVLYRVGYHDLVEELFVRVRNPLADTLQ